MCNNDCPFTCSRTCRPATSFITATHKHVNRVSVSDAVSETVWSSSPQWLQMTAELPSALVLVQTWSDCETIIDHPPLAGLPAYIMSTRTTWGNGTPSHLHSVTNPDTPSHKKYPPGSGVPFFTLMSRLARRAAWSRHLQGGRAQGSSTTVVMWAAVSETRPAPVILVRQYYFNYG